VLLVLALFGVLMISLLLAVCVDRWVHCGEVHCGEALAILGKCGFSDFLGKCQVLQPQQPVDSPPQ